MNSTDTKCRKIKECDLEMIMNWRMLPEITKYMNTDPVLTLEGQKRWFEKISMSENEFHWILETENIPVGVVNAVNWDKNANIIHTGVYIAVKEKRSIKLIADLQLSLYEFVFDVLGVNKIAQEVLGNNLSVVKLNERLGATKEGVLRQAVKKGDEYFDLYVLGILREEWPAIKQKIKYEKIEFEV